MKKVLVGIIVALVLVQPADAHQKKGRHCKSSERRIEKIVDKMDDKLDLTDSQEQKIKALFTDYVSKKKEGHGEQDANFQQLKQNIRALLKGDQLVKFDDMNLVKKMKKCR